MTTYTVYGLSFDPHTPVALASLSFLLFCFLVNVLGAARLVVLSARSGFSSSSSSHDACLPKSCLLSPLFLCDIFLFCCYGRMEQQHSLLLALTAEKLRLYIPPALADQFPHSKHIVVRVLDSGVGMFSASSLQAPRSRRTKAAARISRTLLFPAPCPPDKDGCVRRAHDPGYEVFRSRADRRRAGWSGAVDGARAAQLARAPAPERGRRSRVPGGCRR